MLEMVDQAEIHRKAASDDVEERAEAARLLRDNFADLPDKKQAWNDLIRLAHDGNINIQWDVTDALDSTFQHVMDKDEAWNDLVCLIGGKGCGLWGCVLGSVFPHVPDKEGAWKDLHRLTTNENSDVRQDAAGALGSAFQHIPEKDEAWEDLHKLIQDEEWTVRMFAAGALGYAFQYIPEKDAAWKDIHKLTADEDGILRRGAAGALGSAFQHIPEKDEAWKDLHKLTADEDSDARFGAAEALSQAFQHVPDKKQAWADLIQLTVDEDSDTRLLAAGALGSAFQHVPDKKQAWEDLIQLTEDEDCNVRASANHSSGRASIFRATDAEDEEDFESELKNAIEFFEKSSNEATHLHTPSRFCLPFYRLFYMIASERTGAEDEVQRCLDEAEGVLEGSKNKETLLKAARNLVNASIELQNAGEATIRDFSHHLNNYMQYFDCATKLTDAAERGALGAAQVVQRTISMVGERHKHIQRECDETFKQVYGTLPPVPIQNVHVPGTKQKIVRIAVVQISFELTESFPFVLKNKDEVKTKVFSALKIAKQNGANIVCLPELCLCEDWIREIEEQCPGMIVIGGSFYKDNQNVSPVIMESDVVIPCQPKITPAVTEYDMIPGDRIYRYETRFGKFVILICTDFDDLAHYFREADIDMIFCPSFNSANERFWNEAHSHVERTPSYILIANTGNYGGTSIFGQLDKNDFGKLADRGCKEREDTTYKLCEVKKGCEEVILADFNLIHKSVQRPTPSNLNKVIKSVDHIRKISIQPDRSRSKIGSE